MAKRSGQIRMAFAPETKQARIARILDAAERLVRKSGDCEFTMRALADEAGVSPPTPFNLLDSKSGVLRVLLRRSLAPLEAAAPKHPIEQLFHSWELCTELYASDEVNFRALLVGAGVVPDAALLGMALAETILKEAIAIGSLAPNVKVRPLAESLDLMALGILVLWSPGALHPIAWSRSSTTGWPSCSRRSSRPKVGSGSPSGCVRRNEPCGRWGHSEVETTARVRTEHRQSHQPN